MVQQMKSFNVLDRALNLRDSYLLEASAGTGKTFSIENIVARLLIEDQPPIFLEQILVVTFTKAATSDLKTRIRQNIEKALRFFTILSENEKIPDYIQAIIEKGEEGIHEAVYKLKTALFSFDQAQIFTIHSFCSKMLREHIFEGDIRIDSVVDEPTISNQEIIKVIRNFFRTGLSEKNFSKNQLDILLKKHHSKIENLEKALLKWLNSGLETIMTTGFHDLFIKFKQAFSELSFESEKIISDFKSQIVNYKKYKNEDSEEVLKKVLEFSSLFDKTELTTDDFDMLIKDGLYIIKVLDKKQLRAKLKFIDQTTLFYPNLVSSITEHLFPIIEEASSYEYIFSRLVCLCRKMLERYLKEEEKFRFDDLLKGMNMAIKNNCFLELVRAKYKAAIIDEFQDTDKLQWNIFSNIFLHAIPFYIVGDPKQSIYSFRQADIYTYLKAADSIVNHLSLGVNYRSTEPLVTALNALFNNKINPQLFELPKLAKTLPFPEVSYSENAPSIQFGDNLGSLHFFSAEMELARQKLPIEKLEEQFYFPFMVEQILNLQKNGFHLSQMAILVKDHFQAKRVHAYFREKNLSISMQRLSYLSQSIIFKYLTELLYAVINLNDESALRTALGGFLIGFSSLEIIALNDPEIALHTLAKFYELRKTLFSFNYAKFLEIFLQTTWNGDTVGEKLMSFENGGEYYEDLIQISDLLIQHQSETRCTPEGLLIFLSDFQFMEFDSDDRLKKLCDPHEDSIKTLTIHSSKGLEFDIVFALGLVNRSPTPDIFIPVQHKEKIVLEPLINYDSPNYLNHVQELDAEKARQLYVAMTRAKYRLYAPVAFCLNTKEIAPASASCMELFLAKITPLNDLKVPLLDRVKNLNFESFNSWIEDFSKNFSITHSYLNNYEFSTMNSMVQETVKLLEPPSISVNNEPIFINSFTNISRLKPLENLNRQIPHNFESEIKTPHLLPSGAKTGILLHNILEWLASENYRDFSSRASLKPFIEPYILGTKYEAWSDVFQEIIFNVLHCTLSHFQFKNINPKHAYIEKEFIYPTDINNGFLKGVIDLFFLHEGKYYFLDWKSNWIGPNAEDYTDKALKESMEIHDYYLQAEIYKEAIKRFLHIVESRPFSECFGGIFYIFLRGLNSQNPTSGILHFT
jgi:exodeoxyribonuclease V beta subunit